MPNVSPGDVHINKPLTREYLEAYHAATSRALPPWMQRQIEAIARPSSGGASNRRRPEHTPVESALLRKLDPTHVSDMSDDELTAAWSTLGEWHRLAVRKKMETDVYERAASFCAQEMRKRKLPVEGDLALVAFAKSSVAARIELLPEEINLGRAASIAFDDDAGGIALSYNPLLGDDGEISTALVQVGIPVARSTAVENLDASVHDLGELYDLILRRPGFAAGLPSVGESLTLGAGMFAKAAPEKRLIGYVAAEPNVADTYGHRITVEEVEDQCHRFALGPREVYMEHGELQGLNVDGRWPRRLTGLARTVESCMIWNEVTELFGQKLDEPIRPGSWYVVNYYPDAALWEFLKNTPHGISWRGLATLEQK